MEAVGLHYIQQLQLIVCTDCRYCIAPQRLKTHLQRNSYHGYKGATLHAALAATSQLHVRDPRTVEPPVDSSPIPYLPLETAYQCRFSACKGTKTALSKHKRTVEKHLAKEHNIGHAKGKTPRTAEDILVVKVQSFCAGDQYRPFVVRDACSQLDEPESLHAESESESSHAVATAQDVIAKELDAMYARSEQQWLSTFNRLQASTDAHVDQTPPWLRSTGINRWMIDLQKDKKDLRALLLAETTGNSLPIVFTRMQSDIDRKTPCRQRFTSRLLPCGPSSSL